MRSVFSSVVSTDSVSVRSRPCMQQSIGIRRELKSASSGGVRLSPHDTQEEQLSEFLDEDLYQEPPEKTA